MTTLRRNNQPPGTGGIGNSNNLEELAKNKAEALMNYLDGSVRDQFIAFLEDVKKQADSKNKVDDDLEKLLAHLTEEFPEMDFTDPPNNLSDEELEEVLIYVGLYDPEGKHEQGKIGRQEWVDLPYKEITWQGQQIWHDPTDGYSNNGPLISSAVVVPSGPPTTRDNTPHNPGRRPYGSHQCSSYSGEPVNDPFNFIFTKKLSGKVTQLDFWQSGPPSGGAVTEHVCDNAGYWTSAGGEYCNWRNSKYDTHPGASAGKPYYPTVLEAVTKHPDLKLLYNLGHGTSKSTPEGVDYGVIGVSGYIQPFADMHDNTNDVEGEDFNSVYNNIFASMNICNMYMMYRSDITNEELKELEEEQENFERYGEEIKRLFGPSGKDMFFMDTDERAQRFLNTKLEFTETRCTMIRIAAMAIADAKKCKAPDTSRLLEKLKQNELTWSDCLHWFWLNCSNRRYVPTYADMKEFLDEGYTLHDLYSGKIKWRFGWKGGIDPSYITDILQMHPFSRSKKKAKPEGFGFIPGTPGLPGNHKPGGHKPGGNNNNNGGGSGGGNNNNKPDWINSGENKLSFKEWRKRYKAIHDKKYPKCQGPPCQHFGNGPHNGIGDQNTGSKMTWMEYMWNKHHKKYYPNCRGTYMGGRRPGGTWCEHQPGGNKWGGLDEIDVDQIKGNEKFWKPYWTRYHNAAFPGCPGQWERDLRDHRFPDTNGYCEHHPFYPGNSNPDVDMPEQGVPIRDEIRDEARDRINVDDYPDDWQWIFSHDRDNDGNLIEINWGDNQRPDNNRPNYRPEDIPEGGIHLPGSNENERPVLDHIQGLDPDQYPSLGPDGPGSNLPSRPDERPTLRPDERPTLRPDERPTLDPDQPVLNPDLEYDPNNPILNPDRPDRDPEIPPVLDPTWRPDPDNPVLNPNINWDPDQPIINPDLPPNYPDDIPPVLHPDWRPDADNLNPNVDWDNVPNNPETNRPDVHLGLYDGLVCILGPDDRPIRDRDGNLMGPGGEPIFIRPPEYPDNIPPVLHPDWEPNPDRPPIINPDQDIEIINPDLERPPLNDIINPEWRPDPNAPILNPNHDKPIINPDQRPDTPIINPDLERPNPEDRDPILNPEIDREDLPELNHDPNRRDYILRFHPGVGLILYDTNGNPVTDSDGNYLGPNGSPILNQDRPSNDDREPIINPELTPDRPSEPIINPDWDYNLEQHPDNPIIAPGVDVGDLPLNEHGRPDIHLEQHPEHGVIITGPDGEPIRDNNGNLLGPDGNPIINEDFEPQDDRPPVINPELRPDVDRPEYERPNRAERPDRSHEGIDINVDQDGEPNITIRNFNPDAHPISPEYVEYLEMHGIELLQDGTDIVVRLDPDRSKGPVGSRIPPGGIAIGPDIHIDGVPGAGINISVDGNNPNLPTDPDNIHPIWQDVWNNGNGQIDENGHVQLEFDRVNIDASDDRMEIELNWDRPDPNRPIHNADPEYEIILTDRNGDKITLRPPEMIQDEDGDWVQDGGWTHNGEEFTDEDRKQFEKEWNDFRDQLKEDLDLPPPNLNNRPGVEELHDELLWEIINELAESDQINSIKDALNVFDKVRKALDFMSRAEWILSTFGGEAGSIILAAMIGCKVVAGTVRTLMGAVKQPDIICELNISMPGDECDFFPNRERVEEAMVWKSSKEKFLNKRIGASDIALVMMYKMRHNGYLIDCGAAEKSSLFGTVSRIGIHYLTPSYSTNLGEGDKNYPYFTVIPREYPDIARDVRLGGDYDDSPRRSSLVAMRRDRRFIENQDCWGELAKEHSSYWMPMFHTAVKGPTKQFNYVTYGGNTIKTGTCEEGWGEVWRISGRYESQEKPGGYMANIFTEHGHGFIAKCNYVSDSTSHACIYELSTAQPKPWPWEIGKDCSPKVTMDMELLNYVTKTKNLNLAGAWQLAHIQMNFVDLKDPSNVFHIELDNFETKWKNREMGHQAKGYKLRGLEIGNENSRGYLPRQLHDFDMQKHWAESGDDGTNTYQCRCPLHLKPRFKWNDGKFATIPWDQWGFIGFTYVVWPDNHKNHAGVHVLGVSSVEPHAAVFKRLRFVKEFPTDYQTDKWEPRTIMEPDSY